MHRRDFLGLTALALHAGSNPGPVHAPSPIPLWRPPELRPDGITLRANEHLIASGTGTRGTAMTLGDGPIGPTLRMRRGDRARITLANDLREETILHWHGLRVPEVADGHPRLAIAPGARYEYEFDVGDRAGTYWYHAHPHHRTGEQVYRGMAGLLIVDDEEETAAGLPRGEREIAVFLQDRRLARNGDFAFDPVMHERMEGFFGDTAFCNGTPGASVNVDSARYRLRIVNATASRITRLALSNGAPMTLIGTDGGLLGAPVRVDHVDMGTGERADLLVDFSGLAIGTTVRLVSLPFTSPAEAGPGRGMGRMGAGGLAQGAPMDVLEFVINRAVREPRWIAPAFPMLPAPDRARASRTREFRFMSMMMRHTINGREFELERVDERVRFGTTEVWRFINESAFPHPVHMHEVQFRILERTGGRARVMPWEAGWKDTALVMPGETVDVLATFDAYRGMFLMHCHNLVHEDMGMMMNYVIE